MSDLKQLWQHVQTHGCEDARGWLLPVIYPMSKTQATLCANRGNKVQIYEADSVYPINLDETGAHFWVQRLVKDADQTRPDGATKMVGTTPEAHTPDA